MTIFEAYNDTKKKLEAVGIQDYVFEAKQIIMHITGFTPAKILTDYNKQLTEFQQNNLVAIVHQREVRYPLQYIFGTWEFYGRTFNVGVGALIPRSDTEIGVEKAIELLKDTEKPKVLDLCAGTGCIGLSIALEIPTSDVTLVEKYDEAARYAEKNIVFHEAVNTALIKADVLKPAPFEDNSFDLIISNPPYIPESEMKYTSPEVAFEPKSALLAEDDGLEFYKAIIKNYTPCIKNGGYICFEVGFKQADKVAELLKEIYTNIQKIKDLNGIDRFVIAQKTEE